MNRTEIVEWPRPRSGEVVEVLARAFGSYPVMTHVVGSSGTPEMRADRILRLVRLFVETRYARGGAVLGLLEGERCVAAACVDRPDTPATTPELEELKRAAWSELGEAARARYEDYGEVSAGFAWPSPHFHLGMIGVLPEARGEGHARPLLERVHEMSDADPTSLGVSLTTENRANLTLYQHFGYRVIGEGRSGGLEGWGLFRPRDESA